MGDDLTLVVVKRTPIIRRTPLRSYKPIQRVPLKRKKRRPGFSEDVKAQVRSRSGGWCEAKIEGWCSFRATHIHHVLPRRYNDHTLGNALHCCMHCHSHIHENPEKAYERGLLRRGG